MNYPLLSEYIEAIKSAEDNFEELSSLRPILGDDGLPVMTSGNFAVVFKMHDEQNGRFYAVKCFTKEQEGRAEAYCEIAKEMEKVSSPYILSIRYLDKELFVDTDQTAETEFPVLLMDWVDGTTLDRYLRENLDDKFVIDMLSYRFSQLAQWIIPQPFAHGDLKPDNILVREDGSLVLVDYDGMYVPAMKGQKARELGSPDFRHPRRTEVCFDEHNDDFSIVTILLSLLAISYNPELLDQYGATDRLLLSEKDYSNLNDSNILKAIIPNKQSEINRLAGILALLIEQDINIESLHRLVVLPAPCKYQDNELSTKISINDWEYSWKDGQGVRYNKYGDKLLKAPSSLSTYIVRQGTKVICDNAFIHCKKLLSIIIPDTVNFIGDSAFKYCFILNNVSLPRNLLRLGKETFMACENLQKIVIPSPIKCIEESTFYGCVNLQKVELSNFIEIIGNGAFKGCSSLSSFNMPQMVTHIKGAAFLGCTSLKRILLPDSLISIDGYAFAGCMCDFENKSTVYTTIDKSIYTANRDVLLHCPSDAVYFVIPNSVIRIENAAFAWCNKIQRIIIPDTVKDIGEEVFYNWTNNQEIHFEKSAKYKVNNGTFCGCKSKLSCDETFFLTANNASYICFTVYINNEKTIRKTLLYYSGDDDSFDIPSDVQNIADGAFMGCVSLKKVTIPDSVSSIGDSAFNGCKSLIGVEIPNSTTKIGDSAFQECESLKSVSLPTKLFSIGDSMFWGCCALEKIVFPTNINKIDDYAFWGCSQLKEIIIPDTVTSIGRECFFGGWWRKLELPQSVLSVGDAVLADSLFCIVYVPKGMKKQFERLLGYPDLVICEKE